MNVNIERKINAKVKMNMDSDMVMDIDTDMDMVMDMDTVTPMDMDADMDTDMNMDTGIGHGHRISQIYVISLQSKYKLFLHVLHAHWFFTQQCSKSLRFRVFIEIFSDFTFLQFR